MRLGLFLDRSALDVFDVLIAAVMVALSAKCFLVGLRHPIVATTKTANASYSLASQTS